MGAITELLERRATWITGGDPRTPQYWVKKLFGVPVSDSGIDIDEDKALTYSAVWSAVNIISSAIGFLPFIVYKRDGDNRERQPQHPVYKLLHDQPNPYMDALVFRETLQGHLLTWGNAYALIQRSNNGTPVYLWPLLPNKTEPEVVDNGNKVRYKVTNNNGGTVYYGASDILHFKGLGFDGIKGYSVIRYAANSLGGGMAAEKYGAKFFANNAAPSGVLETPETLSDKGYNRLREDWENKHKGLDNAHKIAILEEGLKWHDIGLPPEDAQYLETRKFGVVEVARWFSIPPHMLAELERATFSNIENQGIGFVTYTLTKWFRRWELESNHKLFFTNEQGKLYTEFLADALLRGNTKERYNAYRVAIMAGWMNRNEARQRENLNTAEGLDEFLQPLNMVAAGTPVEPKGGSQQDNNARYELIAETVRRILTKETNALRLLLNKPAEFFERMEGFYEKHTGHICKVLGPVIRATGNGVDVMLLADEYVNYHSKLLRNAEIVGGSLVATIKPILDSWELTEPARLAGVLTKELCNAE